MNTDIWSILETTDPKYTKDFKKGFSGTAINPTYGMKKLTEVFGPCGDGWGDEIMESRFDEGAWLSEKDREIIHTIILRLWYMMDGIKHEVIGVGTTTFIGKNKHGIYTDEEYFKKTMTDAMTNASKKLGLSADIFMGLYDDSKYLNEVKQKFAPKLKMPKRAEWNKKLSVCKTKEDYNKVQKEFIEEFTNEIWDKPSGHPTKKDETNYQMFTAHLNRVNGEPPVNANTSPTELQTEWAKLADNCRDRETLESLETQVNRNRTLDTEANWGTLEDLHKELD